MKPTIRCFFVALALVTTQSMANVGLDCVIKKGDAREVAHEELIPDPVGYGITPNVHLEETFSKHCIESTSGIFYDDSGGTWSTGGCTGFPRDC